MDYTKKIMYQSNYWYNDGLKRAQIRDISGAIISLRRSLQYNRNNIAARNLLGLLYYGRGEVAEALVEWIISKNLQPRDNIANEYVQNIQDSAKELETVNQAVKKYNQCLVYCTQDAEDMAMIQLKKIISMHPTFLKAYQLLALLYLRTEQYARARQLLKTARKLDTTNEMTLRYMQELAKQRGRRTKENSKAEESNRSKPIEYKQGNDTVIQPGRLGRLESGSRFGWLNLVIGVLVGAAVVWYLIVPATQQSKAARMNKEIIYRAQYSPAQRELGADYALYIAPLLGIIPKLNMQKLY